MKNVFFFGAKIINTLLYQIVTWSCDEPTLFAAPRSSDRCVRVIEHSSCEKAVDPKFAEWSPNFSARYSCYRACSEPLNFASDSLSWSYCLHACPVAEDPGLSEVYRRNPADSSVPV